MADPVLEGIDLNRLNYTSLVPYNETIPTGGNSLIEDLNVHYEVWLLAIALVAATDSVDTLRPAISRGCSRPPLLCYS